MNDDDRKRRAEALIRLSQNPDGALFLREIEKRFDEAMRMLINCNQDAIQTHQGEARAFQDILKMIVDAKKEFKV